MSLRLVFYSLVGVLLLAGCADETPVQPDLATQTEDDGAALEAQDERAWNEDELPAEDDVSSATKFDPAAGVGPTERTYEIILENLTPNTGDGGAQVFSPPVIATHSRAVRMFRVGKHASSELAGIAEDAMNGPMVELLESSPNVHRVRLGEDVIPPGSSATYMMRSSLAKRALSMVFMLVNTNDGFSGVDAVRLPAHGELTLELRAYDAGSEANTELKSDIPGPCCGSVGAGTATRERIHPHPGIQGVGDLDPGKWGWDGPVARLTIRRLEPAYEITLRNLTPDTGDGGAQVFSPPVFASHSPRIRMFKVGRTASDELAGIAEDAMNDPMLELLENSGRALDVQAGGDVIFPGNETTYMLESGRHFRRLSMAFMLVNTNDGFSGVDRLRLPRYGSATYTLHAYDAGSEKNTELVSDIPGPCCGSVGTGTATHERILPHPGILGGGDLDPAKYGWDEPAAELTVTRVR